MKSLKFIWLGSIIAGILLFFDDIAGTDTENAEGLVIANKGMLTGAYSWALLTSTGIIFIVTSILLIGAKFRHG